MKCALCEKDIENYHSEFQHFVIDEKHAADICGGCIDKFLKWQSKKFAVLFPTSAMKKRFGEKNKK
jgi:hypothetical protein